MNLAFSELSKEFNVEVSANGPYRSGSNMLHGGERC